MLSIYFEDLTGKKTEAEDVLTVTLCSESNVPADSLAVTVPYDKALADSVHAVTASDGENIVFSGIADEIISLCDKSRAVIKITARSRAGLLLDNEAQPVTYYCPSAEFISKKHLKPFGITAQDADNTMLSNYFRINKGMSHWQVLENFCKLQYGTSPRIDGDGKAFFKGKSRSEKLIFGEGGHAYVSIKESNRRCELISRVRVKVEEFGGYTSNIINDNPECKGVERVRFLNASTETGGLKIADKIIENSNRSGYSILLLCRGCIVDAIGCRAEIYDKNLGIIDGLEIRRLKYSVDVNGEFTVLELGKET